jgi:hypothetical protein
MDIRDREGANKFWYQIGWDLDTNGNPDSWSSSIGGPELGKNHDGGGAAIADIDGNGKLDLLLMDIRDPDGANKFWYSIGWDRELWFRCRSVLQRRQRRDSKRVRCSTLRIHEQPEHAIRGSNQANGKQR